MQAVSSTIYLFATSTVSMPSSATSTAPCLQLWLYSFKIQQKMPLKEFTAGVRSYAALHTSFPPTSGLRFAVWVTWPVHVDWQVVWSVVVVVVELPRLLCTVVGRKPANPPQESDDIRGIRLDKFPVGQERLPKGFPTLLTPREMFRPSGCPLDCCDARNRYYTSWPSLYQECPSKTRGVVAFARAEGLVWRVWYFLSCVICC